MNIRLRPSPSRQRIPHIRSKVVSAMEEEYFKERLRVQENEIESLSAIFEMARRRGNKKLMGVSRKRLDMAVRLRETYERLLNRREASDQRVYTSTGSKS